MAIAAPIVIFFATPLAEGLRARAYKLIASDRVAALNCKLEAAQLTESEAGKTYQDFAFTLLDKAAGDLTITAFVKGKDGRLLFPRFVVKNDGDVSLETLSVRQIHYVWDRGTGLLILASRGTEVSAHKPPEDRYNRPGIDWIFENSLEPREYARKLVDVPVAALNPSRPLTDIYLFRIEYFLEDSDQKLVKECDYFLSGPKLRTAEQYDREVEPVRPLIVAIQERAAEDFGH